VSKSNRKKGGRTTPKGTQPGGPPRFHRPTGKPSLVEDARARLAEPTPFGLLSLASSIIEATTPRPVDFWRRDAPPRTDGTELFQSFVHSGLPSMESLALAVATMHPDEVLGARLRRQVAEYSDGHGRRPGWLATMGEITITDTVIQTEALGDGDNLMISWRWPSGHPCTAIIYVDHNMGTIVKDSFVVPESLATLVLTFDQIDDGRMIRSALAPADLRARAQEAIAAGERVVPPIENDSWPACRPMIEWLLRHLPAGGAGHVRQEWSEADRVRLLDDFAGSPFGAVKGLTRDAVRDLADPLVFFACDFGPGDPLRWSSVSCEIVLDDWYPRKVFGTPVSVMRRLPEVLAAFVKFAHDRKGLSPDITVETLESVERWTPHFLEAIARPGRSPKSNTVRLARIAAGFDDEDFEDDLLSDGAELAEVLMIDLAGGWDAYDRLNDEPLPDVPFDWSRVPEGMRLPTVEALALLDQWTIDLFDEEVRAIARWLLAEVLARDPGVFKRSPRAEVFAAALLAFLMRWLSDRTSLEDRRQAGWKAQTQKELGAATGVRPGTISTRLATVRATIEWGHLDWSKMLHSAQRREMLRTKALLAEFRESHVED
jgi:hypothetical protein